MRCGLDCAPRGFWHWNLLCGRCGMVTSAQALLTLLCCALLPMRTICLRQSWHATLGAVPGAPQSCVPSLLRLGLDQALWWSGTTVAFRKLHSAARVMHDSIANCGVIAGPGGHVRQKLPCEHSRGGWSFDCRCPIAHARAAKVSTSSVAIARRLCCDRLAFRRAAPDIEGGSLECPGKGARPR